MDGLEKLEKEYREILDRLNQDDGSFSPGEKEELFQKSSLLAKLIFLVKEEKKIEKELEENKKALSDKELAALAGEEIEKLERRKAEIKNEREKLQAQENSRKEDENYVLMEIRAGAGGDEAALFAADLFRMYQAYAQKNNWKLTVLDEHKTSLKGYKEIVFEVLGKEAYPKLVFESGVHRVQRIPATEKSGRIHTSTASVSVLPRAPKNKIEIKPSDIQTSFFHSSGPGGQNVNKVETAVRITHLPSGITVSCQSERSQQRNREKAMEMLKTKLYELEKERIEKEISKERKNQIKRADRAEKIRTYNFPQDRITDHRIKKSWHNLESIFGGNLDEIVESLREGASSQ